MKERRSRSAETNGRKVEQVCFPKPSIVRKRPVCVGRSPECTDAEAESRRARASEKTRKEKEAELQDDSKEEAAVKEKGKEKKRA